MYSCHTTLFVATGFPNEEERLDILRAVSKDMELSDEAQEYLPEIASARKVCTFQELTCKRYVLVAIAIILKLGTNRVAFSCRLHTDHVLSTAGACA